MKYINQTALSVATVVFVFLFLVKIFNISYPFEHRVINTTESSELSVVGEGKVEVVPDTAYVEAGITVSRAATAELAKEQMSKVNNAIIAALKDLGIKKEDIKTSNFSIYPEYEYGDLPVMPMTESSSAGSEPAVISNPRSRIAGYSGNASVSVKIRKTDQASQVIERVTAAGANQVSGARFTVDNPERFREEARNKAIANAKEQAEKLSKSLGIRLGRVTNFIESGDTNPYYARGGVAMSADAKESTPPTIEEGTQTITSTVTLFFERK